MEDVGDPYEELEEMKDGGVDRRPKLAEEDRDEELDEELGDGYGA